MVVAAVQTNCEEAANIKDEACFLREPPFSVFPVCVARWRPSGPFQSPFTNVHTGSAAPDLIRPDTHRSSSLHERSCRKTINKLQDARTHDADQKLRLQVSAPLNSQRVI